MTGALALAGSIVLGAQAQILLRRGVSADAAHTGLRRYVSPWVAGWLVSFILATLLWLRALARMDISFAYPLLGAGYVLVVVLASIFLKEKITRKRWIAVLIIVLGLAIVARSH